MYLFSIGICVTLAVAAIEGKRVSGILKTTKDWKYLTRFCFLPDDGTVQFTFVYPKKYLTQSLLLYWDKPNLWESAYKNTSMTCQEKENLLDITSYQIFRLHPAYGICHLDNDTLSCFSKRFAFKSARERWWYMAISNCHATEGLYIEYDVFMRNGEPGNFFREHFSADERYILEFNIGASFVEIIMLGFVIYVSVKLTEMQLFHSTYKIFLASVVFFLASILVTCIAYMIYASTGTESSGAKNLSTAFYAVSQLLLILMLLLLGFGYTVVCGRLPHWGVITLSVFMSSFAVTYIALYIVEAATFDPALVLYRWESSPGYGLMACILAAWLFYLGCCIFTIVKHKKKAAFYAPMMSFYSLWFISIPVTVAINIRYVPDYSRAMVVNFVEVVSLFLAHLFYLILTWPSLANQNFPFHIKTTQIDVISFDAAAQNAEAESAEASRAADLAGGGVFTDFSIFTVPDERQPGAAAARVGLNEFGSVGRRIGDADGGGGGVGGGGSDWDSGVASIGHQRRSPDADDADMYDSPGGHSGAARLLEGSFGGAGITGVDADGEYTAEQPPEARAAAAAAVDDDGEDARRRRVDNEEEEAAAAAAEVPMPAWLRNGGPASAGGSQAGRLPPI